MPGGAMMRMRITAALVAVSSCCLAAPQALQHQDAPQALQHQHAHQAPRYQARAAYPAPDAAAVWRSLGASYVRKAVRDNQLVRDPVINARLDAVVSAVGQAAASLYPRYSGAAWRALLID